MPLSLLSLLSPMVGKRCSTRSLFSLPWPASNHSFRRRATDSADKLLPEQPSRPCLCARLVYHRPLPVQPSAPARARKAWRALAPPSEIDPAVALLCFVTIGEEEREERNGAAVWSWEIEGEASWGGGRPAMGGCVVRCQASGGHGASAWQSSTVLAFATASKGLRR